MNHKSTQATLKAIAEEAGVTTTTVSCILNRKGLKYAKSTQEKIFAIAERLDYRPNVLALSVRTGRSNIAGVMIPNYDSFYSQINCAIHDTLLAQDIIMMLCWNYHQTLQQKEIKDEQRIIHHLVDRQVDGIILCPTSDEFEDSYFNEISKRDIPLLLVDRELSRFETSYVGTDNEAGGKMAAEHLLKLGHRNFLFIGTEGVSSIKERKDSFVKEVEKQADTKLTTIAYKDGCGKEEIIQQLSLKKDRPTAIFCSHDWNAHNVLGYAKELGLEAPEDFSILGFGDSDIDKMVDGKLCTFGQKPEEIGKAAAEIYLELVNVDSDKIHRKLIQPELIVRQSTKALSIH